MDSIIKTIYSKVFFLQFMVALIQSLIKRKKDYFSNDRIYFGRLMFIGFKIKSL